MWEVYVDASSPSLPPGLRARAPTFVPSSNPNISILTHYPDTFFTTDTYSRPLNESDGLESSDSNDIQDKIPKSGLSSFDKPAVSSYPSYASAPRPPLPLPTYEIEMLWAALPNLPQHDVTGTLPPPVTTRVVGQTWLDGRDVDAEIVSESRRRPRVGDYEGISVGKGEQELVPWSAPGMSDVDADLLESLEG